jgi:hypothetical protein
MYLDRLRNPAKQGSRYDYQDRWSEPERQKNKLIFGAQDFSIKPLSDYFAKLNLLDVFVSKSSLGAL